MIATESLLSYVVTIDQSDSLFEDIILLTYRKFITISIGGSLQGNCHTPKKIPYWKSFKTSTESVKKVLVAKAKCFIATPPISWLARH